MEENKTVHEEVSKRDYNEYFSDILEEYNDALSKAKKYLEMTDKKIEDLSAYDNTVRGVQHYLSEHMQNAAALLGQVRDLIDRKFRVKDTVLSYENKDKDKSGEEESNLVAEVQQIVKTERKENKKEIATNASSDLDAEIEKLLGEDE